MVHTSGGSSSWSGSAPLRRRRRTFSPAPFAPRPLQPRHPGKVLDYSKNHGKDRPALFPLRSGKKRDMYVYLPPGYDPCKRYAMGIYLHGFLSDERTFLTDVVKPIDEAIACGKMPPMVLVSPDASVHGLDCLATYGTFYVEHQPGAVRGLHRLRRLRLGHEDTSRSGPSRRPTSSSACRWAATGPSPRR